MGKLVSGVIFAVAALIGFGVGVDDMHANKHGRPTTLIHRRTYDEDAYRGDQSALLAWVIACTAAGCFGAWLIVTGKDELQAGSGGR